MSSITGHADPHTASHTSTMCELRVSSSSVSWLPPMVDADPHCGESASARRAPPSTPRRSGAAVRLEVRAPVLEPPGRDTTVVSTGTWRRGPKSPDRSESNSRKSRSTPAPRRPSRRPAHSRRSPSVAFVVATTHVHRGSHTRREPSRGAAGDRRDVVVDELLGSSTFGGHHVRVPTSRTNIAERLWSSRLRGARGEVGDLRSNTPGARS